MKTDNIVPITLIIPTYDRGERLERTIHSFLECDSLPNQIIIVDQSNNALKEKIKAFVEEENKKNPSIEFLYIHQDLPSLTKARNTGLEYAKNDIILFSDDDIDVADDVIDILYQDMKRQSIALICAFDNNTKKSTKIKQILSCIIARRDFKKRNVGHVVKSVFGVYPPRQNNNFINTSCFRN